MFKKIAAPVLGALLLGAAVIPQAQAEKKVGPALNYTMKDIDGKAVDLSKYQGKVVMFVNVASKCGLTKQYTSLEKLYGQYKDKGFVVLGFPANEFGGQEPGTNEEIKTFCSTKYNVSFPMFSKIVVKGEGQAPLYKYLTATSQPAGDIEWNFAKFIVGRNGEIVARFKPQVEPTAAEVAAVIEKELAK